MDKGYRRVRPLEGGIEAWIEAGHETAVYETRTNP
jgi:hypothetical protein